jgi:hypothetical protein
VDGQPVAVYPLIRTFDLRDNVRLRPHPQPEPRLVADVHLGRLTAYLRLAGFDTKYRNDYSDDEIVAISASEDRVLLTRDVGVLEHSIVMRGYFLRETQPARQLVEVLRPLDLVTGAAPFTRCLAIIASAQKSLTLASPVALYQAMRAVIKTGTAVRSAWATRRDLLLETLALHHQLGVLARSNKRFRQADRVLWLFLRWWWPRWREALVLVQPATVARWHRDGRSRCRRRRSRRPGRPRIDPACQDLIGRMAAENGLWGAPRIHGELLKLGMVVSERTVSRYLRGRPTTRSQTWRTFFANLLGDRTIISPVMFADARSDDIVIDACDVSSCPTSGSIEGLCVSSHAVNVDGCRSLQHVSLDLRLGHDHLQARKGARRSTGRDPPQASLLRQACRHPAGSFLRAQTATATRRSVKSFASATASPWAFLELPARRNQFITIGRSRTLQSAAQRGRLRRELHVDRNIGEAQPAVLRGAPPRATGAAAQKEGRQTWPSNSRGLSSVGAVSGELNSGPRSRGFVCVARVRARCYVVFGKKLFTDCSLS